MACIAEIAGLPVDLARTSEDRRIDPRGVARELERRPGVTHVAAVHCETSTGIINPIEEIGRVCEAAGRSCIVDSMSGFGALPVDMQAGAVDFLVSSANKCIQGVPGFSFVLCRRDALLGCEGRSSSLSLDLYEQWQTLEQTGQFRFTPPTHAMLAFAPALRELEAEGGPQARGRRYSANQRRLASGMQAIGFKTILPEALQGCVITSFAYPDDHRFDFETFHRQLTDHGFVIYPGKLSDVDCFRIGTAGHLFEDDIDALLEAVSAVATEMGVVPSAETHGTSAPGQA